MAMFSWIMSRSMLAFSLVVGLMGFVLNEMMILGLGGALFIVSMIVVELTDSD